jgi:hypothetical protein
VTAADLDRGLECHPGRNPDQPNDLGWIAGASLCVLLLVGGALLVACEIRLMFDVNFATQTPTGPNPEVHTVSAAAIRIPPEP